MTGGHERRVQAQFAASAALYVASPGHAAGPDLDRLLAWGRALRPARVLDLATGGGHTALAFAGLAPRVVALDLTEAMLHAARAFIRGRGVEHVAFVAGAVERLPFPDGSFPVVTCRIAPHHFADVGAAVREVARVLAPGGSFLVQDILGHDDPGAAAFITEVERRRDPSHVRAYRAAEWRAFLRAAGLTVVDEGVVSKVRPWREWTGRMRMTDDARRELEAFVRAARPDHRAAFDFRLGPDGIESFTDRMILIRADRD
ncbi:MAG TPA: methyltransferase domain-containing protein [Candidatus Binatia bacterium]|nr:methyltransferase domain-containing protein [Candidatus Binatia bacterium]